MVSRNYVQKKGLEENALELPIDKSAIIDTNSTRINYTRCRYESFKYKL